MHPAVISGHVYLDIKTGVNADHSTSPGCPLAWREQQYRQHMMAVFHPALHLPEQTYQGMTNLYTQVDSVNSPDDVVCYSFPVVYYPSPLSLSRLVRDFFYLRP